MLADAPQRHRRHGARVNAISSGGPDTSDRVTLRRMIRPSEMVEDAQRAEAYAEEMRTDIRNRRPARGSDRDVRDAFFRDQRVGRGFMERYALGENERCGAHAVHGGVGF